MTEPKKLGQTFAKILLDIQDLLDMAAPVLSQFVKQGDRAFIDDLLSLGKEEAVRVLGAAAHDFIATMMMELCKAKGYPVMTGMMGVRSCILKPDEKGEMIVPFKPYTQNEFDDDTTFGRVKNAAQMYRLCAEAVKVGPMLKLDLMQRLSQVVLKCDEDDRNVEK